MEKISTKKINELELKKIISSIFVEQLGVDIDEKAIYATEDSDNDLNLPDTLDSLLMLELIMHIETEFEITIHDEEIKQLITFAKLCKCIHSKI